MSVAVTSSNYNKIVVYYYGITVLQLKKLLFKGKLKCPSFFLD